ncbi:putative oxidoreductase [Amycolatopsis arida]|uniref:Putative oxidoreductase n=2 Tax=Amycolatopsis arida TaxID=587909 RepID=A0A1I6ACG9_9PSEU|nr:hypothetical protein CLV69_102730 [Amycolatopsis arida]SFQ66371.1 putative oxidoreductase [Amycolatopsis arida]
MLSHGPQKPFGWFGGAGLASILDFVSAAEIPAAATPPLIAGFAGRVAAFWISAAIIGAILTVHLPIGIFMSWSDRSAEKDSNTIAWPSDWPSSC